MKIPREVFGSIVAYHSTDPSTLVELAAVSRDLREEAERILYKNVHIRPQRQDSSKGLTFLRTVQGSPEKARLVRTFVFGFRTAHACGEDLCNLLCAVLPEMSSLKTLVIQASRDYDHSSIMAALQKSTFSLDHFSSSHELNLTKWALDHPSLIAVAVEGLEMEDYTKYDVDLFRDLASSSGSRGPLAVSSHFRAGTMVNSLAVFPAFSPVVNGVTSWSADPIHEFYTTWFKFAPSVLTLFHVFVDSFADQASMSKILSSIARTFPRVSSINFVVRDDRIDLHPERLSIPLSALTMLRNVNICFDILGRASRAGAYQSQAKRLASLWAKESPLLEGVSFPDGSYFVRRGGGEWDLYRG